LIDNNAKMILKKTFFLFAFAGILQSCSLFKKPVETSAPVVVNLDTLKTEEKDPVLPVYQASATRLNDIIHTKLEVSFDWSKQYMYGKATLTIRPYFYPTAVVELDARGMEIKQVALVTKTGKTDLQYTYADNILHINLDRMYARTEQYLIFIDYISKPNELKKGGSFAITDDKGLYFINPEGKEKNKPQQIWTQGETQSNSVWFPTNDHPNERMTQEIYITTEKKYVTLSNGELVSSSDNGNGTRTDYWRMDLPHAPYLAMMAIGDFAIVKDKWREKEVNYYVEKAYEPYARAIFGNTPEMMEFFSTKLGVPYQWNKYDQIVVRDYVSGAMENTTATLHSEILQQTDRELLDDDHEVYVAHELFHQWFGDLVTCESWSNLPLNESFANYSEYLWEEYKYGSDAADEHSAEFRDGYLAEALRKKVPLIRFQYDNREDMFDAHSYNKGGQVLHMLRKYVGDDAFFASLKLYLETNKFKSAEIHNLRLAFEEVTGEDLNWFFNQWFLSPGHPELLIKTSYDEATKKQMVEIKQTQDFTKVPLFQIPMYIDIYSGGKVERKKITLTKADEINYFDVTQRPDLVNVDAEKALLCRKKETKAIQEWAFQYAHAPLYLDRYEALTGLTEKAKDAVATQTLITALSDKFWSLRKKAIAALQYCQPGHELEIKNKLITLSKTDEKSAVRKAAIDFLSANYKDEELHLVYEMALADKAYSVAGAGLTAIAKVDPKQGMELAKQFENEKNTNILSAVMEVYGSYGSDVNNDFFIKAADQYKSYSKITFIIQYGQFLENVKQYETMDSGIALLTGIATDKNSEKLTAFYAKKEIKTLENDLTRRINAATQQLKTMDPAHPSNEDKVLEEKLEKDKLQKQRITDAYNSIK
jgi:aminopeptidase N